LEFNQLQIFCISAETLNFTKAAVQLGYAQSNITAQIKQLEESLQVKLFERMGRGIQLTNEGKKFLENAKAILQLCEKAKEEFAPNVFCGTLTIGAADTICVHRLPKILIEYRRLYPLVEIRVLTESCDTFIEWIKTNRVDIALILTDKIKSSEMAVRTLCDEQMVVVASPLHPLAQKKRIVPYDLTDECLIITLPGCGYRPLILSMLREYNVKPRSFMELSSIGAIKECTSCGLGVAMLPKVSINYELEKRKLVELDWTGPKIDVKTQLIYHHDKWLTVAMKAFLDLCSSMKP
jgi:DNA-binding transcriptional LysR family regulator